MFDNVPDIQELYRGPNKSWICAVWNGGSYGLLYKNRATAKTIRCSSDKNSKSCHHVGVFNKWESEETADDDIMDENSEEFNDDSESVEFPKSQPFFGGQKSQKYSPHPSIQWPLCDAQHEQFLKLAEEGFQYRDLTNLIPDSSGLCPNGFDWNENCPVKNGQIFSRNVTIHHHSYIRPRSRVAYYRRCTGDCNCMKSYTAPTWEKLALKSIL